MNFLRKLISSWRPRNFSSASTAVLYRTASIVNNLPDASAITIGHNSHIKGELLTFGHGGRIVVGECCYVGEQSHIWSAKEIRIGNRVLIAHNVNIFDNTTHPLGAKERHRQFMSIITGRHPDRLDLSEASVIIEDDAWVGCLSIILKGVTIGRGAVIGAGSVVTRDVPPYAVVAGNPASVIRILSDEER